MVVAQPYLQYPDNAPSIGDITEIQFVSPAGLSPDPSGPGVSWDFSTLGNLASGAIMAIDPAGAPSANLFPDANIVLMMNDSTFTYALLNASGFHYLGAKLTYSGIPITMVYSDSRKFMEYPFGYNDAFTDTYKGISSVMTTEVRASGETVVLADAYGSLVLPTGTFNDVLRIATVDVEIDSIFVKNFFISATITNRTHYHWYAPGSKSPLFNMEIISTSGITDTVCYYTTAGSGTSEPGEGSLSDLLLYPNPASEELQVEFVTDGSTTVRISLINQIGQEMLGRTIDAGVPGTIRETIDVSGLPAGLYFASLHCDCGKQLTRKLVIR